MTEQATWRCLARRHFVLGLTVPIATALSSLPTREAEAAVRERSVLLHHRHTGEKLRTVYYADGRYLPEALRAATHHLRDWRDNTQIPIDPKLLEPALVLARQFADRGAGPGVLRLPLA